MNFIYTFLTSFVFPLITNNIITFTLFGFSITLLYLDNWKLSENTLLKCIQVFSFVSMFLLGCLFIYDIILYGNIILSDDNNKIGTRINNSLNIYTNDKEVGNSWVITGAMCIFIWGVTKSIAESSMSPLQKVGIIFGVYCTLIGFIFILLSFIE